MVLMSLDNAPLLTGKENALVKLIRTLTFIAFLNTIQLQNFIAQCVVIWKASVHTNNKIALGIQLPLYRTVQLYFKSVDAHIPSLIASFDI